MLDVVATSLTYCRANEFRRAAKLLAQIFPLKLAASSEMHNEGRP
jgi:hypothetical protein